MPSYPWRHSGAGFFGAHPASRRSIRAPGTWQRMAEAPDEAAGKPSGLYRASLIAAPAADATNTPIHFRLQATAPDKATTRLAGPSVVEATSKAKVGFWTIRSCGWRGWLRMASR